MSSEGPRAYLATLGDLPIWAPLWKAYVEESYEKGGGILPHEGNLEVYLDLYRAYTEGSLFGFALLGELSGEPVGALLCGESPYGVPLETRAGRCATLWGTFTLPPYRQRGVSRAMQDFGFERARALGFTHTVSSVRLGDREAEANAFQWSGPVVSRGTEILVEIPHGD